VDELRHVIKVAIAESEAAVAAIAEE